MAGGTQTLMAATATAMSGHLKRASWNSLATPSTAWLPESSPAAHGKQAGGDLAHSRHQRSPSGPRPGMEGGGGGGTLKAKVSD